MGGRRSELAAARWRAADERRDELRSLQRRLEDGEKLTESDLALARERAQQSLRLADLAEEQTLAAYSRAAAAHHAAADALQIRGRLGDAATHRLQATADELAASDARAAAISRHPTREQAQPHP